LMGIVAIKSFKDRNLDLTQILPHPAFKKPLPGSEQFAFEFDPNLGWYNRVDHFGSRRVELPPKAPNEYRVVILGGSTVEGFGVKTREETIAYRLQEYLRRANLAAGKTVNVYNQAVASYYSKQELILLATRVLPLMEPDLVVVLDGVNDFVTQSVTRLSLDRPYSDVWHFRELQMTATMDQLFSWKGSLLTFASWGYYSFLRKTLFWTFVDLSFFYFTDAARTLSERIVDPSPRLDPNFGVSSRSKRYYLENILSMKSLCEARGVKFFWFFQPLLVRKAHRTAEEEAIYRGFSPNVWANYSAFQKDISTQLKARFGKGDFAFDISDENIDETAYVDHCHYLAKEQDGIGKKIAAMISKRVR
ncbi:MAG: SGNH/GDSL hydrolase family protein, partial [Bdellovibrionota bacterium]